MKHPQSKDLMNLEEKESPIIYTDLICPFMSNSEKIINCVGIHCAYNKNCYKEFTYKENLNKFFAYSIPIMLALVCLCIILF